MDHCAVAAAVHAQAKAYLARFGHEAMLSDEYALVMTTRKTTAQMRVLLKAGGVDRALTLGLPASLPTKAAIDEVAATIFAEIARTMGPENGVAGSQSSRGDRIG